MFSEFDEAINSLGNLKIELNEIRGLFDLETLEKNK